MNRNMILTAVIMERDGDIDVLSGWDIISSNGGIVYTACLVWELLTHVPLYLILR